MSVRLYALSASLSMSHTHAHNTSTFTALIHPLLFQSCRLNKHLRLSLCEWAVAKWLLLLLLLTFWEIVLLHCRLLSPASVNVGKGGAAGPVRRPTVSCPVGACKKKAV